MRCFMSKSKLTIIIVIAVIVVVSVVLGFTFAPCTVTLDYCDGRFAGTPYATAPTVKKVKVTRFSTYSPPRERVWYKDRGKTIPWVSGDKVTGNITLYAG